MNDPMPSLVPISCISQLDHQRLVDALQAWGLDAIALDGADIVDDTTLRSEVGRQLQMPEGLRLHNASALRDCLHQMFIDRASARVAIVWDHAEQFVRADLQGFLEATNLLDGLASTLYRADNIDLYVFMVGDGDGYRRLEDIAPD